MALIGLSCYSSPALIYEIQPLKVKSKLFEKEGRKGYVYKYVQYENYQGMRLQAKYTGLDFTLNFHSKKYFKNIAGYLYNLDERPIRMPDLTLVGVFIKNHRNTPVKIDYRNFRIRSLGGKRIIAPINIEKYYNGIYSSSLGPLDFYWAFTQKPSLRFLHPLPDWYFTAYLPGTPSPAERIIRKNKYLKEIEKLQNRDVLFGPGEEVKGYLIFPELSSERGYVLEYTPPDKEKTNLSQKNFFLFMPVHFRIQMVREGDSVQMHPEDPEKLEDNYAWKLLKQDERERRRDLRDLYDIHRQLRMHAGMKKSGKAREYFKTKRE